MRLPTRTLQVHWPEGNVLLSGGAAHREPASRVPDYNAVVTVRVAERVRGPDVNRRVVALLIDVAAVVLFVVLGRGRTTRATASRPC